MTEPTPSDDVARGVDDGGELPAELLAALADESTWADVPAGIEDSIIAAIAAEATTMSSEQRRDRPSAGDASAPGDADDSPGVGERPEGADVVDLGGRRRWRDAVLAVAAAAVVIASAAVVFSTLGGSDGGADVELALEATDLAPGASAEVAIDTTPIGTRIVLDLRGLPPAPEGSYYEAWLRVDAEVGVSAGTFHMRGGDGEIELWAGVTIDEYPLFTVTLQDEGAGAASSGRVVLRGLVGG